MPDFTQVHSQGWLDFFAGSGFPGVRPLAAGVEGAIYDLGDGTVAKVWGKRRFNEREVMQTFYAEVAAAGRCPLRRRHRREHHEHVRS